MKPASIFKLFSASLLLLGYVFSNSKISLAQVVPDNTVNTQVNQNDNVAEINGGETRGDNLFHSFQDFSLTTGQTAFFDNANNISNIFSRVTGGNISNIDGLIRANGSASLYLINPAGIILGENARLDIGGSFFTSTASSILFEDGEFSATDLDTPPLLTVNAPIGLGFRDNPGDITYRASIQEDLVEPGNNVSLIGGNVNLDDGDIVVTGGNIQLASVSGLGEIGIEEDGRVSFSDAIARGNVTVSNDSNVFVSSNQGESIKIDAKNLSVNSDSFIGISIPNNGSSENAQIGDIAIDLTEDLTIDGGDSDGVGSTSISSLNSGTANPGNPGNIEIDARNVEIFNSGQIGNLSSGNGEPGNIIINARENIIFNGFFSGISNGLDAGVAANTGDINLTAQNLDILNGAGINNLVLENGSSGNINLNISDTIRISGRGQGFSPPQSTASSILIGVGGNGNTGDLIINARNLLLNDGGLIVNSNTGQGRIGNAEIDVDVLEIAEGSVIDSSVQGSGNGASININAQDRISISGNSDVFSLISVDVNPDATGEAGDITINTPRLILDNAFISADVRGNGSGGEIDIQTRELSLDNNSFISADVLSGDGNAGEIDIQATDSLGLSNGSLIVANTSEGSTGNAGDITIGGGKLILESGSQIGATTRGSGNAGNLTVIAESIDISGANEDLLDRSGLFAKAFVGNGNGGSLSITTGELNISDGAAVEVGNLPSFEDSDTVAGTGEAGNIIINANSINLFNQGRIDAATQSAVGEGANITLSVAEDITLRDGSFISARAIEEGDGGNLDIDSRFIIAFPGGNNDIIASAQQGNGGNIEINAESLFGIQQRPLNNLTNDINASSEISGLDGTIAITTPDLNPTQGVIELPSNTIAPQETTAQACQANRASAAKNGLNITGKGGIVSDPGLPFNSGNVLVDGKSDSTTSFPQSIETSQGKVLPARGIKINQSGEIVLTAYRTNNAGERIPQADINCS